MNKIISALAAACLFCGITGSALAADPYVAASVGIMMPTDSDYSYMDDAIEYETGYDLGVAAGYKWEQVRLELAFDYTEADVDEVADMDVSDGDVNTKALMVNAYYTVPVSDAVGIYGMAGVGMAEIEVEDSVWNEDDTVMAGNVGLGATFAVAKNVEMDLGWKYFLTEDADIMGEDLSYSDNRVTLGVRYIF